MTAALKWFLIIAGLILASACEFSGAVTSAKLTPLKFYKDKTSEIEIATFSPSDTVYAKTFASNVPKEGITVRFRVFVESQEAPVGEWYIEVAKDGVVWFHMNKDDGIPPGKYRIEASRLLTVGEQAEKGTVVVAK
jgi:hypothetical protein